MSSRWRRHRWLSSRVAHTPRKVRQFLAWLAGAEVDADPLGTVDGRDWAVRDYRAYLQAVLKRSPATVNNALAAVDDFYIRRGLGPASAKRVDVPAAAPAGNEREGAGSVSPRGAGVLVAA